MRNKWLELSVGFFILLGFLALLFLAFKVSGLTTISNGNYYSLKANFDNIGDLKVRAPVTISGVTVGRVTAIHLDRQSFRANVDIEINNHYLDLPEDTTASILTQGLLGSNYISLSPGFEKNTLKPGGRIETTHSALILENLVGQLMFNLSSDKSKKN